MKKTIFILILFCVTSSLFAQENDSLRMKKFFDSVTFPAIKMEGGSPAMGVIPYASKEFRFPKGKPVKVAIDLTTDMGDSASWSYGLTDVGRTFNLHVANGADPSRLDMVVIVHANSHVFFFTNEKYKSVYGVDNPNLPLIETLRSHGIKFYVCYQSLFFRGASEKDLIPGLEPVLSAKTSLTWLQQQGYSLLYID